MPKTPVIVGIAAAARVAASAGLYFFASDPVAPPSKFVLLDGTTKTTADLTNLDNIDTSSVPTKIDEYYQPYLDTYHSELSRAENG